MSSISKEKIWTDEDRYFHMSWCLKNDIKIYFEPVTMTTGVLVIEDEGNRFISEETYKSDNTLYSVKYYKQSKVKKIIWSERIFELYTIKYLEKNGKK